MELIPIFADHLWSVKYPGEVEDEYNRLFHLWNDMIYLESYIEENLDKLKALFWQEHGCYDTAASAAMKVYDEANDLFGWFKKLNDNLINGDKPDFDAHFKLLHKIVLKESNMPRREAYGLDIPSMIRLYALRMADNAYIITGGGIKLSKKMNEDPMLLSELDKMKDVEKWLQKENIL